MEVEQKEEYKDAVQKQWGGGGGGEGGCFIFYFFILPYSMINFFLEAMESFTSNTTTVGVDITTAEQFAW